MFTVSKPTVKTRLLSTISVNKPERPVAAVPLRAAGVRAPPAPSRGAPPLDRPVQVVEERRVAHRTAVQSANCLSTFLASLLMMNSY